LEVKEMDKDYLPTLVFLAFFLNNVIAGVLLYFGIPTTNPTPPDSISLGQLLFLIFVANGPLLCIISYALYKQKRKKNTSN